MSQIKICLTFAGPSGKNRYAPLLSFSFRVPYDIYFISILIFSLSDDSATALKKIDQK